MLGNDIQPSEFISRFVSIPESSSMYYTNSAEYAQVFALMLGEQEIAVKIQEMKENTSPDIGVELYRVEADVLRYMNSPDKKFTYQFRNGKTKTFTIDFMYKELKRVRFNLFSYVSQLMVKHKLQFPINISSDKIKEKKYDIDKTKVAQPKY
jgi:hypothetical protein